MRKNVLNYVLVQVGFKEDPYLAFKTWLFMNAHANRSRHYCMIYELSCDWDKILLIVNMTFLFR